MSDLQQDMELVTLVTLVTGAGVKTDEDDTKSNEARRMLVYGCGLSVLR
jgi:hypothetical protein